MSNRRFLRHLPLLMSMTSVAFPQQEPARMPLARLFSYADKVAVVEVLAGTTEAYDVVMYKGKVVEALKGTSAGDVIYFGPYLRTQIGAEYVLFLKDQPEQMQPNNKETGYGAVRYSTVFNEGYSSMLISYECVFGGATPDQQCAPAVRVCTDYILLPKTLPTSPPERTETPFGCRWIKRDQFISELRGMPTSEH